MGVHAGAHAPGAKAGQHGPRPTVRLTAVAAAAALFTVLTATAAQSPEGLRQPHRNVYAARRGSAKAPPRRPLLAAPGDAASGGGGSGAAAGAAGGAQDPVRGLEASARKNG